MQLVYGTGATAGQSSYNWEETTVNLAIKSHDSNIEESPQRLTPKERYGGTRTFRHDSDIPPQTDLNLPGHVWRRPRGKFLPIISRSLPLLQESRNCHWVELNHFLFKT